MDSTINEPSPPTFAPSNLFAFTVDSLGSRHSAMKDEDAASISRGSKSMSKSISMSTEWTDEKHSLYLDSMEASFVQHLYTNNFISSSNPEKKEQSKASSFTSSKPFGRQFKVLRDGQWGRIDFERNNNWKRQTDVEEDGAALLLMNPWIRHFRSGRSQTAAYNARKEGILAEASSSSCIAAESSTEMIDQNFGDEDDGNIQVAEEQEEEMVKSKRIRTWTIASPRKKDKVKLKNKML